MSFFYSQGMAEKTKYPNWVLGIAIAMISASILPIILVYLLRRFQILKVDLDIHQGSIRRNETTASTKEMIDEDDVSFMFDVSYEFICVMTNILNINLHTLRLDRLHKI